MALEVDVGVRDMPTTYYRAPHSTRPSVQSVPRYFARLGIPLAYTMHKLQIFMHDYAPLARTFGPLSDDRRAEGNEFFPKNSTIQAPLIFFVIIAPD